MSGADWLVLAATLLGISAYGTWRARGGARTLDRFLRGDESIRWPAIGLSVMATQASAITFLSTPGQAYDDGLRFIQFYFGLPLAMVVLSVTFVPRFVGARVRTAYELLETRFDLKTRQLAAALFLLQRGLAAGLTLYAPAIIVAHVLGWPLNVTTSVIGLLVIVYTVTGGTQAVVVTQKYQMAVMMGGVAVALGYVVTSLPPEVSFTQALKLGGALGKMNAVELSLDPNSRYTLWSGLTGGFFLAMAYFGTDQSQVGRYITTASVAQSRLGLLFNGLFKIPMQFFILLTGVMVLVFHAFVAPPVFFNASELERVRRSPHAASLARTEEVHARAFEERRAAAEAYLAAPPESAERADARASLVRADGRMREAREEARGLVRAAHPDAETKDSDFVFLSFVMAYLPTGLRGLLLAVIFSAAMSGVASELSALGATATVDFYRRSFAVQRSDAHYLVASKLFTAGFGLLAIGFAAGAQLIDNLIEAVNLLGSLFYGALLGIFLVAFYAPRVRGTPVFLAALAAEAVVFTTYATSDLGFLWFNVLGCAVVVLLSLLFEAVARRGAPST